MKSVRWVRLFLTLNMSVFGFYTNAACISDFNFQQLKLPSSLQASELSQLVTFAEKGYPAKGWKLLGTLGDPYAAVAAKVLTAENNLTGAYYNNLITHHWVQANGLDKYRKNFYSVAKQHFKQYVEIIRATGNYPDSDQILNSYFKAIRDHGLRDITVFDGAWDAAGMNIIRSWQKLNHIEEARTVFPTKACFNINSREAKTLIANDLLQATPF